MKDIETMTIKYVGYKDPDNGDEVEFEIFGLRTAIAAAEHRIYMLSQSLKLQSMSIKAHSEETDEKTVEKANSAKEVEQKG